MVTVVKRAGDYSKLLELMTAREYAKRFEPHLFEIFPDFEGALREATARAESVAARYGLAPATDGRYPLAIWDLTRSAPIADR
jgi:hypothetical protein